MSTLHAHHLIGGEHRREAEPSFRAVAAATGEALDPAYANASDSEIDAALSLAAEVHGADELAAVDQRAAFLDTIAAEIDVRAEAITARAQLETGLPPARLIAERGRTTAQLRAFAALVRDGSWVGARIDHAREGQPDLRRMLVALGPVVVFGAGNFPLAFSVAGGDTASAIAAGCPVVVKGHPSHPGTSELVGDAVVEAAATVGLPAGVFALVHGLERRVGRALVEHPSTRALGFTGSYQGGRALFEIAAARPRPIPVFAEMGSINPVFVLPGALAARGAEIAGGAAASLTLGVGQFCTNPGVMLIPTGEPGDRFVEQLRLALSEVPAGVMLDPRIFSSYLQGLQRRSALDGLRRIDAGPEIEGEDRATPVLFMTSAKRFLAEPSLHDELFGPSTLVVRWRDREELLSLACALQGQLSATIHAEADDRELAAALARPLCDRVGRLVYNGFPTGVAVKPAMHHGGPWPASSDPRATSVGTAAIERFARPVCLQDMPAELLPPELRDDNPRGLLRLVDGEPSK